MHFPRHTIDIIFMCIHANHDQDAYAYFLPQYIHVLLPCFAQILAELSEDISLQAGHLGGNVFPKCLSCQDMC